MENNYSWNLEDDFIAHYGKGHDDSPPGRGSGRYPWGSGAKRVQKTAGKAAKSAAKTVASIVKKPIEQFKKDVNTKLYVKDNLFQTSGAANKRVIQMMNDELANSKAYKQLQAAKSENQARENRRDSQSLFYGQSHVDVDKLERAVAKERNRIVKRHLNEITDAYLEDMGIEPNRTVVGYTKELIGTALLTQVK